jgi:signal transduction histidine kinase
MGPYSSPQAELIAELSHEINSPLAAVRNALYLAGCCHDDPRLQTYLQLAQAELCAIAASLRIARSRIEHMAQEEAAGRKLCRKTAA